MFLISCNLFVKNIFVWVKFSNILSAPHLIALAWEHCSEHDPIILDSCRKVLLYNGKSRDLSRIISPKGKL